MSILKSKYETLIIYYFSGTGNAKNAATWICNKALQFSIKTYLINIDRFKEIELPDHTSRTLVGFCTPTHGFNIPPIVIKFIRKFPALKNADAFILNTRAGMKLYKLFLPGLSGIAQIFPAIMLKAKGFNIVGMQPLDLPSNWLILHPGLRLKVVNSIYKRCNSIVNNFAEAILSGKKKYKALWSLPIDLAIIPLSIGYYFVGRFFFAKTLIATDACNQCEKCVKHCPVSAIKMVHDKPYWMYNCESCMRCVNACPTRAIETTHSYTGLVILISSIIISPLIIRFFENMGIWDWFEHSRLSKNLWTLINSFIFILFVFICYKLLHLLMRFRFFNKLIAYSSLSKYNWWRRYKAPKIKRDIV